MAVRLGTTPIVIPDSTHLPMLENCDATAEELVRIFEWVAQVAGAGATRHPHEHERA
jgi:urease accessory protein UreE